MVTIFKNALYPWNSNSDVLFTPYVYEQTYQPLKTTAKDIV